MTQILSSVAGIVDKNNGLRVVVTPRWRLKYHVKKRERAFVVPDLLVQEPVPWDEIPLLIARVQRYVVKELAPKNDCGDCRACCKTLYIKDVDFEKPSHSECVNCDDQVGCKLYFARPKVCREFECLWLKSQSRNDIMAPELRPDRCGVIFCDDTSAPTDPDLFEVHPDVSRPGCVDAPVVRTFIDREQSYGRKAKLITFYHGEKPS